MTSCPQADGSTYTDTDGQEYVLYCEQAYEGSDLPAQAASTWDQCLGYCDNYVRNINEDDGAACIAIVWAYDNPNPTNCYLKYALETGIASQRGSNAARRVQYQVGQSPMYVDFPTPPPTQSPAPVSTQASQQPVIVQPVSTPAQPVQQPATTPAQAQSQAKPVANTVTDIISASANNPQATPTESPQSKAASNPTSAIAASITTSVRTSSLSLPSPDHASTNTPLPTGTVTGAINKTQSIPTARPDVTLAVSTLPGGETLYSTIVYDATITNSNTSPTGLVSAQGNQINSAGLTTNDKIGLAAGVIVTAMILFLISLLAYLRYRKNRTQRLRGSRLEPEEKIVMGYQAEPLELWSSYNGMIGLHELHGDDAPELDSKRIEANGGDQKGGYSSAGGAGDDNSSSSKKEVRPKSLPRPPSGIHPLKWSSSSSRPKSDAPSTPNALMDSTGRPMSDAILGQKWLGRKAWNSKFPKSSLSESVTVNPITGEVRKMDTY
ncbi:MAG: hypothetical protein MMC33_003994 [Icmadophila ericetorum]|nr:hypothetical protein [Icmadophila ericetorum]